MKNLEYIMLLKEYKKLGGEKAWKERIGDLNQLQTLRKEITVFELAMPTQDIIDSVYQINSKLN